MHRTIGKAAVVVYPPTLAECRATLSPVGPSAGLFVFPANFSKTDNAKVASRNEQLPY